MIQDFTRPIAPLQAPKDGGVRPMALCPHRPRLRDKLFDPVMTARDVNVHYGDKCAVRNVSLDIGRNQVLALIGPSGCGKSTFLRCLNRMNDTIASARVSGTITLDGQDIYDQAIRTWRSCARASASCFRSPRRFRIRSTPMWRMDREFTV